MLFRSVANFHGEIYNLPFNMNTFSKMWGVTTPDEARAKIDEQVQNSGISAPQNLEEQAISMVGKDIYFKLVKEYTEKQWGRDCKELPSFIIKRLPVRFTYDNNYFSDRYQGIPEGGYTQLIEKLLEGSDIKLGAEYVANKARFDALADKVLYTGALDELFGYSLGKLEYRTLEFKTKVVDCDNYQGNAVINYTSHDKPYTRIIEHKHFEFGKQPKTVITEEYPKTWRPGDEPYYPVNNDKNNALAEEYRALAEKEGYLLGGRLADYKYYDMDKIILSALNLAERTL